MTNRGYWRNWKYLLLIIAAGVLMTLPTLLYGIPFYTDDGIVHAVYYSRFLDQLRSGEIYPRWLFGMNCGFGSPTFYFYPPLPYYLTSLAKPLFATDIHGLRQLGISSSMALISSGIFSWLWLIQFSSRTAAVLASILYMLMPYHLAYDLYARAAFAEFWTFTWIPLILFFTFRVAHSKRHSMAGLAIAFAALILTHLLTTLIFAPIPLCYAASLAEPKERRTTIFKTTVALAIGAGLAAVFWLPAITTGRLIHLETATSIYTQWFLFGLSKGSSLRYVWFALEVMTLVVISFFVARYRPSRLSNRQTRFWAFIALCALVMMTPLSKPLWSLFYPLQMLQFPWRFNAVLSVSAVPMLAFAFDALQRPFSLRERVLIILVTIAAIHWTVYAFGRASKDYPELTPDSASTARRYRQLEEAPEVPQFQIKSARSGGTAAIPMLLQDLQKKCDAQGTAIVEEGNGQVSVEHWSYERVDLRVNATVPSQVVVSQFYYPGWLAQLRDDQIELPVEASNQHGLVTIAVPAGTHSIVLRREPLTEERVGRIISGIALLSLVALWASQLRRRSDATTTTI